MGHFLLPISTFFSSLAGLCNPARHPKARLLVRVNASAIAIYVQGNIRCDICDGKAQELPDYEASGFAVCDVWDVSFICLSGGRRNKCWNVILCWG